MLPPLLLLPAAAAGTTLAAAASAPRSVVLHVAPGAAGGSSCTNATSADDFTCPTLPAALVLAATLDNANSTVVFAGTQAVRDPLQLRSAAPPASLRLLGGAGAVIDGGGSSALLQVSGSGAPEQLYARVRGGWRPTLKLQRTSCPPRARFSQ